MKRVILLGGGKSIREGIEQGLWDKIKNEEVWSINYGFLMMPYLPKREIWADISFFKNNIDRLQNLANSGVQCYAKAHPKYSYLKQINSIPCTRESKNVKEGTIFIGKMGLSGFFALQLAVMDNYEEIFLLGYDFGTAEKNDTDTHFYQNQIKVISTGVGAPKLYRNSNGKIREEVKDFEIFTHGNNKIYNVSLYSNIPFFERISYGTMFERLNAN